MDNVVSLRGLSEAEYDKARAQLAAKRRDAGAKWDQELARLFIKSGWTQERLAAKEDKSQPWIACHLRFGQFLNFITTGNNADALPDDLTERKFRGYWEQTSGANKEERFMEVLRLMSKPRRPEMITAAIESFGDGKWHPIEVVAKALEATPKQVETALRRSTRIDLEKKAVGKSHHLRLFHKDKKISPAELTEKLQPIIEALKAEGKKRQEQASPPTISHLAHQLAKLLEEWT